MKENKKYFIDTNVFLRVLIKEDKKTFLECKKLFERIKKGEIQAYTSSLVLAEIHWVLNSFYKLQKKEILKALASILNLRHLKITEKVDPALALRLYSNFKVKFIDCLIASNPEIFSKKTTIISYDKDFDKLGVKRKTPSQI